MHSQNKSLKKNWTNKLDTEDRKNMTYIHI